MFLCYQMTILLISSCMAAMSLILFLMNRLLTKLYENREVLKNLKLSAEHFSGLQEDASQSYVVFFFCLIYLIVCVIVNVIVIFVLNLKVSDRHTARLISCHPLLLGYLFPCLQLHKNNLRAYGPKMKKWHEMFMFFVLTKFFILLLVEKTKRKYTQKIISKTIYNP